MDSYWHIKHVKMVNKGKNIEIEHDINKCRKGCDHHIISTKQSIQTILNKQSKSKSTSSDTKYWHSVTCHI